MFRQSKYERTDDDSRNLSHCPRRRPGGGMETIMKQHLRKIHTYVKPYSAPPCREEHIQKTIRRSAQAFCEHEAEHLLSASEFLYTQGRYIRKRWWFLQGLLLLLLWIYMKYTGSGPHIQRCMGILVPFFALLIMPELWKDRMADAVEIECTTLYSLRQMYAARMFLFALVDLFLITAFLTMISVTMQIQTAELIIQFFLPFNVTCCICFQSLYSRQRRSEPVALFLCMLWITFWTRIILTDRIYELITLPVWGLLLAGSVFWLYGCIRKVWKNCRMLPYK